MKPIHLTTDKIMPQAKCACGRLYTARDLQDQYRYPVELTDRHTLIVWSVVSILTCTFCGVARVHTMRVFCDANAQTNDTVLWNSGKYKVL